MTEDKWNKARERMNAYIEAVFWQDLGIGGAEGKKYTDWILDRIVRPEFDNALDVKSPENWCVMRLDDNGNEFVMESELSFNEATRMSREFEAKGHKQTYWVRRQ